LTYRQLTTKLIGDMKAKGIQKLAYNLGEAATALGVTYRAVYRMVRGGQLRAVRVGRRIIIPRSALEELLGERREAE
jgi:excisionase family DNA binding protein